MPNVMLFYKVYSLINWLLT